MGNETKDPRFATTLARGLSVLQAFRPSDDGLSNLEISERTGMPKSSVSRLTFTLQSLGYLSHAGHGARYHLGPALLAVGNVASASLSFVEMATEIMQSLANHTETLVVLGMRDGNKVLLLKTWRPQAASSVWMEVGYKFPIIGSSSGQALMAAYSEEEFEALRSKNTESEAELERIRDEGYSQLLTQGFVVEMSNRFTSKINAVSAVFRSQEFGEPMVFTCGGVPELLTEERMRSTVGPSLHAAVKKLNKVTGRPEALVVRG